MRLIFQHFWVLLIISTVVNAIMIKSKSRQYIIEDEGLKAGYDKIFKGIIIYGNIPWIIIALGIISGSINNVFDVFRPHTLNPFVLMFHAYCIVFWILSVWWIYFRNGAEFLERHPGIMQKNSLFSANRPLNAREIKIIVPFMLLGGVVAMVLMWFIEIPELPDF